jgi:peptidoglycan/xylan/chitin deacetylase (PgdA/CDA1 family)
MKAYLRSWLRRAACAYRPRTLVLVYHHIWNPSETLSWITTPPDQFAEQMAFLSDQRLAAPMDTLLSDLREGRCRNGGRVVVTFDDATVDTYGVAYPILRRYGVPATVFVPTGLIGTDQPLWWNRLHYLGLAAESKGIALCDVISRRFAQRMDETPETALWRSLRELDSTSRAEELDAYAGALGVTEKKPGPGPMSWDQLGELDRSGLITLGAHTVSHPMLSTLTNEELVSEVFDSRDALASFGSFRKVFAYPYGDPPALCEKAKAVLRDAGFEAGFTTATEPVTGTEDRMALGRVTVDNMRLGEFRWLIDHHLSRQN